MESPVSPASFGPSPPKSAWAWPCPDLQCPDFEVLRLGTQEGHHYQRLLPYRLGTGDTAVTSLALPEIDL